MRRGLFLFLVLAGGGGRRSGRLFLIRFPVLLLFAVALLLLVLLLVLFALLRVPIRQLVVDQVVQGDDGAHQRRQVDHQHLVVGLNVKRIRKIVVRDIGQ